ncbi:hypothetical protein H2198_010940 [Neophaeococcomyces mojaviensis]|uniref:Uncharacterized protein n=1 Tax=Neophaeococcomyces mojaviensis TaxID=3383035 RepID=A0ACC2ZNJ2_9EURO|nr:hypothetical protein H2198_010940 [Knufia sp. JES_112]
MAHGVKGLSGPPGRVHDYVRGEEVGQTIAVPTYAACDVHGLEKEIQLKARASGKAYVRLMEAENVSPIVLGILQGAFSFASEYRTSILNDALDLWSCSRMNAYDRSLVGTETLGQIKIGDRHSPFFDSVPIPPKLDYQCDMVGIEWQNKLADRIMKRLWKFVNTKDRKHWLEFFLTVFVMLNNIEFVYGVADELRHQYAQHAADEDHIQRGLDKFIQHWSWSANHLLHLFEIYSKNKPMLLDNSLINIARTTYPCQAIQDLLDFLGEASSKFEPLSISSKKNNDFNFQLYWSGALIRVPE